MKINGKYTVLAGLYLAQTLPGHFFTNAFPVILRQEGASLQTIGLLQIMALPWVLKFLWAPLVDRLAAKGGGYARYIIGLEIAFALVSVALAFFDFRQNFNLVLLLMGLSFFVAATQDIATDAYAIRLLDPSQRGVGNGVQTGANMLGAVLGAGGALIMYTHLGWQKTMLVIGLVVFLPLIPLLGAKPEKPFEQNRPKAGFRDLLTFLKDSAKRKWLLLIFLANGCGMAAIFMSKPLLVDLGFSPDFIGFASGIYGVGIGVAGAFVGGLMVSRWGKRKVFLAGLLFNCLGVLFLFPLSLGYKNLVYLFVGMGVSLNAFAFLLTAINTIAMDHARIGREGCDYSLQLAVSFLGGVVLSGISGVVAHNFGFAALFGGLSLLSLLVFGLTQRIWPKIQSPSGGHSDTPLVKAGSATP
ncbi:MFS transporter [Dethiosulfatarculus sandiegensis]|uniref:MFS transporter n=1 Tax=Dethiosulfatarculus sandiegensis TaxID=1429043 RepID=A0A0D2GM66_9BACT|nr:MFS transporter [Dethiosulfatarculus sandiegensis]KIX15802.1 MFS transporter [Dethiosulfatarculus sandiegensis]